MDKKDLILVRSARETDRNFILSSWLRGLRFGNDWFWAIHPGVYYENYRPFVIKLLERSSIKIACLKDDEDLILGYSVYEGPRLHWVFVKPAWRKLGIAKDLTPQDISTITHITKIGASLKPQNWIFNPFLI